MARFCETFEGMFGCAIDHSLIVAGLTVQNMP